MLRISFHYVVLGLINVFESENSSWSDMNLLIRLSDHHLVSQWHPTLILPDYTTTCLL
jgi:hypothetical protein